MVRIKNWSKFQHFKDRTPPWIKLYREILDDPDWHALSGEAAKTLVMLWVIASEDKTSMGALPDVRRLSFRLRMPEKKLEQLLCDLSQWLISDDIETISGRHQSDAPETERETETDNTLPSEEVETPSVPTIAECPHSEILKLWAEILPSARQPADWNAQRQALLRSRWREKPARQSVDWWRRLFEYVSRSDFLMGRTSSRDRAPFLLSLDWLLKPANFLKVLEGAYEPAEASHA